jgi:hypothetical protein
MTNFDATQLPDNGDTEDEALLVVVAQARLELAAAHAGLRMARRTLAQADAAVEAAKALTGELRPN